MLVMAGGANPTLSIVCEGWICLSMAIGQLRCRYGRLMMQHGMWHVNIIIDILWGHAASGG